MPFGALQPLELLHDRLQFVGVSGRWMSPTFRLQGVQPRRQSGQTEPQFVRIGQGLIALLLNLNDTMPESMDSSHCRT